MGRRLETRGHWGSLPAGGRAGDGARGRAEAGARGRAEAGARGRVGAGAGGRVGAGAPGGMAWEWPWGWRFLALGLVLGMAAGGCDHRAGAPDRDAAVDGGRDGGADGGPGPDAGDGTAPDSGPPPACPQPGWAADLAWAPGPPLAPLPVLVDGLAAVPVDLQSVDATVVLDATAQTAEVVVSVAFAVGPVAGMPVFDLRQGIDEATLDGVGVPPAALAHHDFGGGPGAELRVLERTLGPCTAHRLDLRYALGPPDAPGGEGGALGPWLAWVSAEADPGPGPTPGPLRPAVRWDFGFTDLAPGRYLEMWLPANLIYDRFPLRLNLTLGSAVTHRLITNAAVEALGPGRWRLAFAPRGTALSPLVVLRPAVELETTGRTVALPVGPPVEVTLHRALGVPEPASEPAFLDRVEGALQAFATSTGPYLHDGRLTLYLWEDVVRGMEYDGGATCAPDALEHEIFHAWYGRGLKPALGRDGWIDEAWATWNTDPDHAFEVLALPDATPSLALAPGSPWVRMTPTWAYDGQVLFAHLAFLLGVDALRTAMAGLYAAEAAESGRLTTEGLEQHLYCLGEDPAVAEAFWKHVYGQGGARPPATLPPCP